MRNGIDTPPSRMRDMEDPEFSDLITVRPEHLGSGLSNSSTGKMVGSGNNTQRMMSHSEGLPRNKEQLGQQLFLF